MPRVQRELDRPRSSRATASGIGASTATSHPRNAETADGRPIAGGLASRDLGLFGVAALLTVVDALATLVWLQIGIADEANPVLVGYIEMFGAGVAMVGRAFWGLALLVGLLVLAPYTRSAKQALPVVVVALSVVGALHLHGLLHYL